jgi:hypothetical protein
LADLLDAIDAGIDVEGYLECRGCGATHLEVMEAGRANNLSGYPYYRQAGASHADIMSTGDGADFEQIAAQFGLVDIEDHFYASVTQQLIGGSYRALRGLGLTHHQAATVHSVGVYHLDGSSSSMIRVTSEHRMADVKLSNVHSPAACAGQYCCIHNPSDHPLTTWPQVWQSNKRLMERQCPHGVSHPDPDDPQATLPVELAHGCDGCCQGAYSQAQS